MYFIRIDENNTITQYCLAEDLKTLNPAFAIGGFYVNEIPMPVDNTIPYYLIYDTISKLVNIVYIEVNNDTNE